MELVVDATDMPELSVKLRFAKMVIAASAGFIASEVAKKTFDKVVQHRLNKT